MGTQDDFLNNPPHRHGHEAAASSSWTQFISVRCGRARLSSEEKKIESEEKSITSITELHHDDLEPVRLNHYHDQSEPEDLQLLAQQLSLFEDEDNEVGYLHVKCATLREDIVVQMMMCINDDAQIQMKALCSLGVSLFTLFSGGQRLKEKEEEEKESSSTEEARGTESYDTQYNNQSSKKMCQIPSGSPYGETLKSLGIPIALCELISNMIDATGDESYTTMSAVRDDLKMLMDKPDLYLRDLDITHVSDIGLQFETSSGHTCFGREAELEALKESYHRSISSECEVVMISGPSGIGKSMLSSNFCQYITLGNVNDDDVGSGGIILSGGFDRLQAQPFQSFSSAFDQYCTWLLTKDQSTIERRFLLH